MIRHDGRYYLTIKDAHLLKTNCRAKTKGHKRETLYDFICLAARPEGVSIDDLKPYRINVGILRDKVKYIARILPKLAGGTSPKAPAAACLSVHEITVLKDYCHIILHELRE